MAGSEADKKMEGAHGRNGVRRSIAASPIRFRCRTTRHSGRRSKGTNRGSLRLRVLGLRGGKLKMSARDAARLLGVSHQRVHQLVHDAG